MYRDTNAVNKRGLDLFSNSAHNIFIDLASTGGFVLFLSYLSIIGAVAISVFRVFKRNINVSFEYKTLIILWAAFNLQTVININVPSLGIWGWIFSGLLLAYKDTGRFDKSVRKRQVKRVSQSFILNGIVYSMFCAALVSPLIIRDVKLADSLSRNEIPKISHALLTYPRDADEMAGVAIAYEKLGRGREALDLAKYAIFENPNSARAWRVIYESAVSNSFEKDRAQIALKSLDPFYFQVSTSP